MFGSTQPEYHPAVLRKITLVLLRAPECFQVTLQVPWRYARYGRMPQARSKASSARSRLLRSRANSGAPAKVRFHARLSTSWSPRTTNEEIRHAEEAPEAGS